MSTVNRGTTGLAKRALIPPLMLGRSILEARVVAIMPTKHPGQPLVIFDQDDLARLGTLAGVGDAHVAAEQLASVGLWGRLPDGRYYIKDWVGCSIHPDVSTQEQRKTREYKRWRRAVLKRDGHRCQSCGTRDGQMHAHHIGAWATEPQRRLDIDNGITLCAECHTLMHRGNQNAVE